MNNQVDKFQIEGIDEVLKSLETLPLRITNKILQDANRDVLTRILKPAIQSALAYSSYTKRGIKVTKARGTENGMYVGVSTDAFYLRFLQFGTTDRVTKGKLNRSSAWVGGVKVKTKSRSGGGASRGRVNPRETGVVSTIEAKTGEVIRAVTQEYGQYVARAITRQLKKYSVK